MIKKDKLTLDILHINFIPKLFFFKDPGIFERTSCENMPLHF